MSATRTLDVPAMDERTYLAWEADTDGKFELVDGQPRAIPAGRARTTASAPTSAPSSGPI